MQKEIPMNKNGDTMLLSSDERIQLSMKGAHVAGGQEQCLQFIKSHITAYIAFLNIIYHTCYHHLV